MKPSISDSTLIARTLLPSPPIASYNTGTSPDDIICKVYVVYEMNLQSIHLALLSPIFCRFHILARSPFAARAARLRNCSRNCIRPNVPYVIVATKRMAHTPVMIPPMGKIKICRPGRTNGALAATTRVWMGG